MRSPLCNDSALLLHTDTHTSYVDLAVECVDAAQLLQERADVAQLIGAVFALYCSYSVQLGSPKLKIPVDPHAWASLASVEAIMTSACVQQWFPEAAGQVLTMLKRLEYDEKAFLMCLRGFNAQHRQSFEAGASSRAVQIPERLQQVTQDQVDRLALLKEQYAQRMSAIASHDSSAGLRTKKDSLMAQVSAETEVREAAMGQWTQALDSFMEPPAAPMPSMPIESSTVMLEEQDHDQAMSYSGDEDNNFALLEAELQASLTQQTTGSTRSRGFSFASSDDALAELDAELSREVESVVVAISRSVAKKAPVRRKTPAAPRRRVAAAVSSSVPSSDAGSDDLAVLQAELDAAPNQKLPAAAVKPRTTRKRPVPRSVSVADSDDLTVLQAKVDSAPAAPGGQQTKRVQPRRTTTRKPRAPVAQASSAPLSTAESDDLAALQAELDALPLNEDAKTRSSTKKKAQAPQRRAPRKPQATAVTQRQRAPSSVSEAGSVDYLAALQAELDSTPLPTCSTSAVISSKTASKQSARRATRKRSTPASITPIFSAAPLSVASSDSAMNDLQAELESSLNLLKASEPQAKKPAKRARTTATTTKRAPAKSRARAPAQRKLPVKPRAAPQPRMMTRARSVSSVASESDGLAELEAELQAAP